MWLFPLVYFFYYDSKELNDVRNKNNDNYNRTKNKITGNKTAIHLLLCPISNMEKNEDIS